MNAPRLQIMGYAGALLATFALASSSQAALVSLPGSALLGFEHRGFVTFPTTEPTRKGSSILFGSGAEEFEKLLSFPAHTRNLYGSSAIEIDVAVNLTMRPCEGAGCLGIDDWDPIFLLGDGSALLGIQFDNDGYLYGEHFVDRGATGDRLLHSTFYLGRAPVMGQAFDIGFRFVLTASGTSVTVQYDGTAPTYSFDRAMDPAGGLHFVFMRDNDFGEQHQINRVLLDPSNAVARGSPYLAAFERLAEVPLPGALWLFLSGLAGTGLAATYRKRLAA